MSSGAKGLTNDRPATSLDDDRLTSWKEIAVYLKCSERTVRRWEGEGLPVHRHSHRKKAGIYAYKSEIDAWRERGRQRLEVTETAIEEQTTPTLGHRRWFLISSAALLLLLVILGVLNANRVRRGLFGKAPPRHIEALAVLPLQNLSRDPEQNYFAQGMTEELITDLAQIGSLRVISSTSSMQYQGTKKPLPEIARELKVDAILEGTVQRSGDRVHITAQLVDAANDQHIWAKAYDRDLRDVLALENELARSVATEIQVQLTPGQTQRLASTLAVNRDAYESYLKGRYFWNKRNPEDLKKALGYFQQATDAQPDFAPAFAGMADTYSLLGAAGFDVLPRLEAAQKARAAAKKAIELDDGMAEAHASIGFVLYSYDWNWPAAEKEFKQAILLNPNYPTAHEWYSELLNDFGRKEESLSEADAALALDPISVLANQFVARARYFAHDFDAAIETSQKSLELDPSFSIAHLRLGRAYAAKGMYADAVTEFREYGRLSDDESLATASIGNAIARSGDRSGAVRSLARLDALSKQKPVPAICFALVHIGLDDKHQSFVWLDKAYEEHSDFLLVLRVDPLFDPLRSDAHFQDLLRRIGLTQ
jgi:TolB-like protein/Tfp pilus assembly protein PilF